MKKFNKGDFVKVGNSIGVIVFLENENDIPEDHVGIWYGETNNANFPKYRTVPEEYCEIIKKSESYH